jgi:transposase
LTKTAQTKHPKKQPPEYVEGPKARKNFEKAMKAIFRAQGLSNDIIAARLDTPRQIVSKWRKRFAFARLPGLESHFLSTRCIEEVGLKSSARSLYNAYKEWAQETNEWTMPERRFSTALTDRGLTRVRHSAGIMWEGIAVLGCEDPPGGDY